MATSFKVADVALPGEAPNCFALPAGDLPKRYQEAVDNFIIDQKVPETEQAKVRAVLGNFESGEAENLVQSSPYRLVLLQAILPPHQTLIARPRLESAKRKDNAFMLNLYVDYGLNLDLTRGEPEINASQAIALREDLQQVGIDATKARLLPYHVLEPQFNQNSGLVFRLSEQGKALAKIAVLNTKDFKWHYSPNQSGLFWAYLNGDGDWGCSGRNLEFSDRVGGVVVESAGGTAQNLTALAERQKAIRNTALAGYNALIEEAIKARDALR